LLSLQTHLAGDRDTSTLQAEVSFCFQTMTKIEGQGAILTMKSTRKIRINCMDNYEDYLAEVFSAYSFAFR
jgi:hypothetical protein